MCTIYNLNQIRPTVFFGVPIDKDNGARRLGLRL